MARPEHPLAADPRRGVAIVWPTVTCVMTAYNCRGYVVRAIRSVLTQEYPPDLLDVVVVDDGSTDDTGALLDAEFGDAERVRIIHQANQGTAGATNTAMAAVTGELVAILDGDDEWTPGRLRRQVAVLIDRPEVGLVHGDMEIIDAAGRTLHRSFFTYNEFGSPPRGRVLGQLLKGPNFVSSSAAVLRSSLLAQICPIPDVPAQDWYLATRAAEYAAIDRVDGTVARYRVHDANKGGNASGAGWYAKMRSNLRLQRLLLGTVASEVLPLPVVSEAVSTMLVNAQLAALELGTLPDQILPVSAAQRAGAARIVREAAERFMAGSIRRAGDDWVRALALDPWNGEAQASLAVACARLERDPEPRATVSAVVPTRSHAVLAFADELLAVPELLRAYASRFDGRADVTLLIQAPSGGLAAIAGALESAVAATGLDDPDAADLLLHECADIDELLVAPVRAVYSRRDPPSSLAGLPRYDDRSVGELPAILTS